MPMWWNDSEERYGQFAASMIEITGIHRVALINGRPEFFWGAFENSPGVWVVFAFGTELFGQCYKSVSRHILNILIPTIISRGAVTAMCWASDSHVESCRWLEFLGAIEQTVLPMGKDGQLYRLYTWNRDVLVAESAQGARRFSAAARAVLALDRPN